MQGDDDGGMDGNDGSDGMATKGKLWSSAKTLRRAARKTTTGELSTMSTVYKSGQWLLVGWSMAVLIFIGLQAKGTSELYMHNHLCSLLSRDFRNVFTAN